MISNIDQRVLFWDDSASSFTDITKQVNTNDSSSASLTFDAGDKLYIGSYFPINHKYLRVSTANIVPSTVSIEYYGASQWNAVVDTLDYTDSAGVPLSQSGILQFTPDRDEPWNLVTDSSDESFLTEFASGPVIYDKYWTRISFSAVVSFDLQYVGALLANESDLTDEYPHLNQSVLLSSWEAGKTDWFDQRLAASEYVIKDLTKKSVIIERSQVLDVATLQDAAVHKCAVIIMNGLGAKNYVAEIEAAQKMYSLAINIKKYDIDANANGQKERFEKNLTINRATR